MAIARRKRSGMFGLVAALVGVLIISGAPMVKAAEPSTGGVLPPDAQPLGYSLRDMARKGAAFVAHANDLDYYPHTRLQILYSNEFEPVFEPTGCEEPFTPPCGVTFVGGNSFTVPQGTQFYVPVQSVDDSAPVIGTFPGRDGAADYFFDPSQVGGEDYRVVVDGEATELGPEYLAGPIGVNRLYDGGGVNKIITLAAFVDALPVGTHSVHIEGQLAGEDFTAATGWAHWAGDFTYQVTVTG